MAGRSDCGVYTRTTRKMSREEKIRERDERDARAEAAEKNLLHTLACEKDGLTMVGMWKSMRLDAHNQVRRHLFAMQYFHVVC